MRRWLTVPLILGLPGLAAAHDPACLISFDTAQLDVCQQRVQLVNDELAPLADLNAFAASPLRLVKFDGPIHAEQRQALEALGVRILGYAPFHSYLVRMDLSLERSVRGIDGVTWTGPYLPIFKLDINLANDLASEARGGKGTSIIEQGELDRLTIALHPGADLGRSMDLLGALDGIEYQVTEQAFDYQRLVVQFSREQLKANVMTLAAQDDIASISLRWDAEFMNSQAGWLHQSGTQGNLPIFEQGIFGCGQIVAAADSGLHATHCSFSDTSFGQPVTSVCPNGSNCPAVTPNFNHRKIGAHYKWDGSTSGAPADGQGHGTHVMGSLTGNNPAGAVDCQNLTTPGGLTDLDGTAPGAKLISQEMGANLQYLNSLGGTIYHAAAIAFENGARIHNNSWGSSCRTGLLQTCIAGCQVEYRTTTRDADRAVWEFPELALFVAAGNSGGLGGNAGCGPGADIGAAGNAKNVFSIGSNNRGTGGNNMSGFSSRGPTQDRRLKPDMTAQGASILSASRTACGSVSNSGTSMATPTAAGLAALVREYLVRGFYPTGMATAANEISAPSAALIKAIMINGAQEITGTGTTGGAPSQSQGWGRVNLNNALYFDGDARKLWLHDGTQGLQTGQTESHVVNAQSGQPLIFTMTFHDAPALVNANPHTVNMLRLEVTDPAGNVWTQKLPATGGLNNPNPFQSTDSGNYDDRNNVHQIRFNAPATGPYQVVVRGIQVAEGPQRYALAVTGDLLGLTDPGFVLSSTPSTALVCAGSPVEVNVGVLSFEGFNDPVTLSVDGLTGVSTAFSVNPVVPALPPAQSVLSFPTSAALVGTRTVSVLGNSSGPGFPASSGSSTFSLTVLGAAPGAGGLLLPANGATDQALAPAFSWSAFSGAAQHRIQVASDPGFANLLINELVTGTSFTPSQGLQTGTTYYWRVLGVNVCGQGSASPTFSFTTGNVICANPQLPIPDNSPTGITSVISVGDAGELESLIVELDISHTYVGDVRVSLQKGATTIDLVNRPGVPATTFGCSGDNIRVFLDDSASLSIQNNCTSGGAGVEAYIAGGSYRPAQNLAAFTGVDFAGDWTLRVSDNASTDTGTLHRWCLVPELKVVEPPPPEGEADLGMSAFLLPNPVEAGSMLTMLVQVGNFGPDTANTVRVTMDMLAGLSYQAARTVDEQGNVLLSGPQWSCTATGTVLECGLSAPMMAPSLAPVLMVEAQVSPGMRPGVKTMPVAVASELDDPVPGNNAMSMQFTVTNADVIFLSGFETSVP